MAPLIVNNIEVIQTPTIPPAWPTPKEPSRVELSAGSQKTPDHRPLPCDIILERDQPLTLRDGTRIRVDIFRPKTDEKVPAILMWSPYGKTDTGAAQYDADCAVAYQILTVSSRHPESPRSSFTMWRSPEQAVGLRVV